MRIATYNACAHVQHEIVLIMHISRFILCFLKVGVQFVLENIKIYAINSFLLNIFSNKLL